MFNLVITRVYVNKRGEVFFLHDQPRLFRQLVLYIYVSRNAIALMQKEEAKKNPPMDDFKKMKAIKYLTLNCFIRKQENLDWLYHSIQLTTRPRLHPWPPHLHSILGR